MNSFYCQLFKPKVWNRYRAIERKKKERLARLVIVFNELSEWDDVPISWQFTSICKTLKIKPTKAAYQFVQMLCLPGMELRINELARQIPLE